MNPSLKLRIQHPQLLDSITLVKRLKALERRIRGGSPCRTAIYACEWIESELQRRAAAALHEVTIR